MRCPHCSRNIGILSRAWQAQRGEDTRHCPACQGAVEVGYRSRDFAIAGILTAFVMMYLLRGLGMPAPLAMAVAGLAGFNAGLFGSMRFHVPPDAEALANMPYRRLSTERFVAYLLLALASIAVVALGAAIWLPAPWSSITLLAVGGLLVYRPHLHVGEWRLEGRAAQLYGGLVLLAGLYLGYVYILRY